MNDPNQCNHWNPFVCLHQARDVPLSWELAHATANEIVLAARFEAQKMLSDLHMRYQSSAVDATSSEMTERTQHPVFEGSLLDRQCDNLKLDLKPAEPSF
jgi:hypothetical protein